MGSKYKYDKDGKATHFSYKNPRTNEYEYESIDDPSGADYLVEKLKHGMNQPELNAARKREQAARKK